MFGKVMAISLLVHAGSRMQRRVSAAVLYAGQVSTETVCLHSEEQGRNADEL